MEKLTSGSPRGDRLPSIRWRYFAIVAVVSCSLQLSGCGLFGTRFDPPSVTVADLKPLRFKFFEQRYGLQLRVQNPNPKPLQIEGIDFKLFLNGAEFAHGVSAVGVTVPAYGEALLDVEVVSTLMRMFEQIRKAYKDRSRTLSYRISGHVSLARSLAKLPFDRSGELLLEK